MSRPFGRRPSFRFLHTPFQRIVVTSVALALALWLVSWGVVWTSLDADHVQAWAKALPFLDHLWTEQDETVQPYRLMGMAMLGSLLILAMLSVIVRNARAQQALVIELMQSSEANKKLIIQLEKEKQSAFSLAAHDHLTGLPNRRMFQELVSSHLLTAKRSRQSFA